jgi:hypothetical protein
MAVILLSLSDQLVTTLKRWAVSNVYRVNSTVVCPVGYAECMTLGPVACKHALALRLTFAFMPTPNDLQTQRISIRTRLFCLALPSP